MAYFWFFHFYEGESKGLELLTSSIQRIDNQVSACSSEGDDSEMDTPDSLR